MDLDVASPATVSRCGMIFMEPAALGWEPMFESWKNNLPKMFHIVNKQVISQMFKRFCPILLWFIRKGGLKEMAPSSDSNLVRSIMQLFDCFMDDFLVEPVDKSLEASVKEVEIRAQIEGIFFFSSIWALGGNLDHESRVKFSELYRGLMEKVFPDELNVKFKVPKEIQPENLAKPYIFPIPKLGSVFDYRYIKEGKGKWRPWADELAAAEPARDRPFNQIIVPTIETIRICAIMDFLVKHGKHLMIVVSIKKNLINLTLILLYFRVQLELARALM